MGQNVIEIKRFYDYQPKQIEIDYVKRYVERKYDWRLVRYRQHYLSLGRGFRRGDFGSESNETHNLFKAIVSIKILRIEWGPLSTIVFGQEIYTRGILLSTHWGETKVVNNRRTPFLLFICSHAGLYGARLTSRDSFPMVNEVSFLEAHKFKAISEQGTNTTTNTLLLGRSSKDLE